MSKNTYEKTEDLIRQELLYLAHQLIKEKNEMTFRNHIENNRVRESNGKPLVEFSAQIISEEDIFEVAEKLNAFVLNKK